MKYIDFNSGKFDVFVSYEKMQIEDGPIAFEYCDDIKGGHCAHYDLPGLYLRGKSVLYFLEKIKKGESLEELVKLMENVIIEDLG